jgi:TM2 domain-containing membrane protein YozV
MTSRRILIVAGWILAGLFGLAGVANFALGQAVSIVAGISALALGATAAVTLWLFIAAGGWTRDEAPIPDFDQRVRVPERAREPHKRRTFRQPPSAQAGGRGASDMSPVGEAGKTHLGTPVFPSAPRDS